MIPKAVLDCQPIVASICATLKYQNNFNPLLPLAIIWQESGGNRFAWNPEPRYRWFMNVKTRKPFRKVTDDEIAAETPPPDFPCLAGDPDQEYWAQQASWGLLQLMGSSARERGFNGPYLTQLVDPDINIELGLKHLWIYAYRNGIETTERALLRWNGGGDAQYANKVLKKLNEIESR